MTIDPNDKERQSVNAVATLKNSDFLRHNAVFFAGSVLVGALNYLYYPVLGRLMEPAAFGEVQTLVSLFLQFTILLNILGILTVNIMANYPDRSKAHHVIFELEKIAVYGALVLLVMSIAAGPWLQSRLQFGSALPFTALVLAFLASIPLTFRSAYARSQKRFGVASVSQLIGAGAKLMLSVGLVVLGLGTLGAIGGIVLAQLVAFFYAARWAGRLGFLRPRGVHYGKLPNLRIAKPELKYVGIVLGGLLSITLLASIDVIVVKYFFDAHTAGLYAGIATVARIILFLGAPIAQVMMPSLTISRSARANQLLLLKSLGLTVAVSAPVLIACILSPGLLVELLMGSDYTAYASLLPLLATAIFVISLANLLCMYSLSLRQRAPTIIAAIGFVVGLGLIIIRHDSLHAIVSSILISASLIFAGTAASILATTKREPRYE